MRQLVAALAFPTLVGCSLIYNPSDLPRPNEGNDSRIDAPDIVLDADPTQLVLERVSPTIIFEGAGTGGSRKALITVIGKQMVKGAKISITAHDGVGDPMITVDDAATEVQDDGFIVSAPITIAVNSALNAATAPLRLDVTITQPGLAGEDIVRTLGELATPELPVLELRYLDELTDANNAPLPTAVAHEYSQVMVTTGVSAADNTAPLRIRARGSVSITGLANVNAAAEAAGPGGGNGGGGGAALLGTGGAGLGDGGGKPNGGGGGFATVGTAGQDADTGGAIAGSPSLPILGGPNRGSGGAGGRGGALVIDGPGGPGGGGGGTIEITAGGTLMVGMIEAKGANGSTGANNGGGGSGGVVLLRGGAIAAGTIVVAGGTGPGNGGDGGIGRIRLDAAVAAAPTTDPPAYRGPMFEAVTPLITRASQPTVTVFGERNTAFTYFFLNDEGNIRGPFDGTIGPNGFTEFPLAMPLFRGINTVCTLIDGAEIADEKPEGRNCIEIVHLFQLP